MAKLNPIFFSVVCVGSFNPAILSTGFLKDSCGFELAGEITEENTPFVSKIENTEISILAELSKFQIVQRHYDKQGMQAIVDLGLKYLDVLKYTPISAFGVNFYFTCSDVPADGLNPKFYEHLRNIGLEFSNDLEMVSTMKYDRAGLAKLRGAEIRIRVLDELIGRLSLNNLNGEMTVNLNFEISKLDKKRDGAVSLKKQFDEIVKLKEEICNKAFKILD